MSCGVSEGSSGYQPSRRSSPEFVIPEASACPAETRVIIASATNSAPSHRGRQRTARDRCVNESRCRPMIPLAILAPRRSLRLCQPPPRHAGGAPLEDRARTAIRPAPPQLRSAAPRRGPLYRRGDMAYVDSQRAPHLQRAIELRSAEARVLGCLLEKQRTTPDAYPLSLNALRLACNQSTNRDPVVDYDDAVIRDALHRLERRGFTRLASGAGSRAAKYRHLLADVLPLDTGEQRVLCVLLLRGAQTPGELKQRTERMHAFSELAAVMDTLEALIAREIVVRLERRPGQKEERYRQLLGAEDAETDTAPEPRPAAAVSPPPGATADDLGERERRLEAEVAGLRAALRAAIGDPVGESRP